MKNLFLLLQVIIFSGIYSHTFYPMSNDQFRQDQQVSSNVLGAPRLQRVSRLQTLDASEIHSKHYFNVRTSVMKAFLAEELKKSNKPADVSEENLNRLCEIIKGFTSERDMKNKLFAIAVDQNNDEILEKLISDPEVDVNSAYGFQVSPLFLAVFKEHYQAVEKLLAHSNTQVNAVDSLGRTAFLIACYQGNLEIVKLFLKNTDLDINKSDKYDQTPLFIAAKEGKSEVVELLLQKEGIVKINQANIYGSTPLLIALFKNHFDIATRLLKAFGIDVNTITVHRCTPLHLAVQKNNLDIVKMLLEFEDINVNVNDYQAMTPVMLAASSGNAELTKLLLKKKAHINLRSDMGKALMDHLLSEEHHSMIAMLSFYQYMFEKKLNYVLKLRLEEIDLEDLVDKIDLIYAPQFFIFIAQSLEEEQQAQFLCNRFLELTTQRKKNTIKDSDQCQVCHKTQKQIQEENKDKSLRHFLCKSACTGRLLCFNCFFNKYRKQVYLEKSVF